MVQKRKKLSFVDVLGFSVCNSPVDEVVASAMSSSFQTVVNTINPHSYVEQKSDVEFENALLSSDVLIPDGSGIVFAAKFINGIDIKKVAGFDLFVATMDRMQKVGGRVFFLGSSENVLNLIDSRASCEYPAVEVGLMSPPYRPRFNDADIDSFVEKINEFRPDVIFVGLTAPKQEKLISRLRYKVSARMVSGIGAVFDFYAGTVRRPSPFWTHLHLEWLVRLVGEPKRLWRRNFISTPIFLRDVLVAKLKSGKSGA